MSTKSFDWSGARAEKWRTQLDGLEAMLSPVDEPLIRALDLTAPGRIADVGCGSGATTLAVRRTAPPGSVVHGFDLSPTLVEVARGRTPVDGTIDFSVADMGTATVPDGPYHRLTSRFGVMFFTDPHAAFANLRRWLLPEGRFAFAVWGPLNDNPWMVTIREVVAGIIDLPPVDTAAPGPFRYEDAETFLSVLDHAGFAALDVVDWRGKLPIGNSLAAASAANFAIAAFSSFAELLTEAGGDALPEARRALSERFAPYEEDGRVRMSARVHIVRGKVGA